MPDLTCAVVHWNVPGLLAECLASLLAEVERLRRRGLVVDVVVVDNASRPEVRDRLRAETPEGVRVLWSDENLGYPRACNLAYEAGGAPLFLLSNPDVVYLPGSLEALVRALDEAPEAALAGPATWWDRERTLLMNPGYPEDRERIEADAEARRTETWPAHALAWERRMAELAFAPGTREAEILSGACMLVRREPIDAAGGLFDPALFLYYDDTDLCFRLRARGMPILYVPGAEIVHLFNQSRRSDVADRMAASRRYFLAKHYGAEEAERLLRLAADGVPAEEDFAAWRPRDLGVLEGPRPFTWQIPSDPLSANPLSANHFAAPLPPPLRLGASLFALGVNPQVVPAALARSESPEIHLTEEFWSQLTPGPYWARATDAATGRVLAYWKLVRP